MLGPVLRGDRFALACRMPSSEQQGHGMRTLQTGYIVTSSQFTKGRRPEVEKALASSSPRWGIK